VVETWRATGFASDRSAGWLAMLADGGKPFSEGLEPSSPGRFPGAGLFLIQHQ